MGETFIPLADLRYAAERPRIPEHAAPPSGLLADRLGRKPVYLTAIALFGIGIAYAPQAVTVLASARPGEEGSNRRPSTNRSGRAAWPGTLRA